MMLRGMLTERFKLQVHVEARKADQYSLTIAKGGPKFKSRVETAGSLDDASSQVPHRFDVDAEGYPILTKGSWTAHASDHSSMRVEGKGVEQLAQALAIELRTPVHDETGLAGKYDFMLRWVLHPSDTHPGPDLITAVSEQLGLSLELKKTPVDFLIVDHVERIPTAN